MHNIPFFVRQRALIVVSVLLLHGFALWALQSGLLLRLAVLAEEIVVPVAVIAEPPPVIKPAAMVPPVAQPIAPKPKPALSRVTPVSEPHAAAQQTPAQVAAPMAAAAPLAVAGFPMANAPQGVSQAVPAVAPAASESVARLELPSSAADYLHNPRPKYPALSISRNEQGTVRLAVLVGADGRAKEVKIKTSSGFDRLDRAARDAVLGWTFVPGKRAGVPEEMWYELPMPFRLTE